MPPTAYTITFLQNCQSLKRHIQDTRADILALIIVMFVELANTDSDDDIHLEDFNIFRNDFRKERSPYGSAVYYHNVCVARFQILNLKNIETTLVTLHQPLHLFCIYCRPKEKAEHIVKHISKPQPYLDNSKCNGLIGDFNIKPNEESTVLRKMANLGLRQLIKEPTTNKNTIIGHINTDNQCNGMKRGYTLECLRHTARIISHYGCQFYTKIMR